MASYHPNLALTYNWALGEFYKTEMDENLVRLGAMVQLSVISRVLTSAPASPAEGDRYIIGAAPTGVWASKADQIALWINAAWVYFIPKKGTLAFIEAEDKISVFKTAWSAGVAI